MKEPTKNQILEMLINHPMLFGHLIGFDSLEEMHNNWIIDMVSGEGDKTLQAHRGSYKTTCVSIALAIIIFLHPKDETIFIRKTDTDVIEIINQVKKILTSQVMQVFSLVLYRKNIILTKDNSSEVSTNLNTSISGSSQLIGMGIGGSITGKHADRIFTDDIVNKKDRASRAEREATKLAYQELINIKNRGGRIYNTGTPWHKEDAFTLMPAAEKFDCYSTGLISKEELQSLKDSMSPSLFAANYELRHIADDELIFTNPVTGGDPSMVEQGECHIDAAYEGEDWTAFTICHRIGDTYYVFGKTWRKHVDDVLDEIIEWRKHFNAGKFHLEDNADKGYLKKEIRGKGERAVSYHESMNKHIKIITYLKAVWKQVVFVEGTDKQYIDMICEYNENAEHDDPPDSLSSIIRKIGIKKDKKDEKTFLFYNKDLLE